MEEKNINTQNDQYFINPGLKNVIPLQNGTIIDTLFMQDFAQWDILNNKCLGLYQGMIDSPSPKMMEISDSQILIYTNRNIKIFNLQTRQLLQQFKTTDQVTALAKTESSENVILSTSSSFQLFNLTTGSPVKQVKILSPISEIINLQSGNYATISGQQIHYIDKDLKAFKPVFSQGDINCYCAITDNQIAVGRTQTIQIIDCAKNGIKNILKGYLDTYSNLVFLKNGQLASCTNTGIIRFWDISKPKCVRHIQMKDNNFQKIWEISNTAKIACIDQLNRKIFIWDYSSASDAPQSVIEGGLKNVQKVIQLSKKIISMLITKGDFLQGQMVFKQIIEVYDLDTNTVIKTHEITRMKTSINKETFITDNKNNVAFLLKQSSVEVDLFCIWNWIDNSIEELEFTVPNHQSSHFFSFERIAILYNLSVRGDMLGIGDFYKKGDCGIKVYDFQLKQIFERSFDVDFTAQVVEMRDVNSLVLINDKNQMEFWDITQNTMISKVECDPNIFLSIKYIRDYIFLLTEKQEFILWDADDLDIIQKREAKNIKKIVKIELFVTDCLILYTSGLLELFNVESGESRPSKIGYGIQDFIVKDDKILLVGEGFMQLTSREGI